MGNGFCVDVVLLIVAGGVGLLMMRSLPASAVQAEVPLKQTNDAIPVQAVETAASETATSVSEPEVSEAPTIVANDQPRRSTPRQFKPRADDNQIVVQEESPATAEPVPCNSCDASV